jgi:hypothetical protein
MDATGVDLAHAVVPGNRVGPFKLGMSLYEVLNVLKLLAPASETSKKTLLCFSRSSPLEKPIVVDVCSLGVKLRFDPKYQKLLVIDVYDVDILAMSFQGHLVGGKNNSSSENRSLKLLYEILGVTHTGFRKDELPRDNFCLQYPGLLVAFQVPVKEVFTGIPLVLTGGTSPPLVRVVVHEFEFVRNVAKPIVRSTGTLDIYVSDDRPVEIHFREKGGVIAIGESTCQDLISLLGASSKLYIKQQEPIGTKARRQVKDAESGNDDYFLNYFELGLDVLVNGSNNTVRKVILRTNLLAHPAFGQYEKCSFTVKFAERLQSTSKRSGQNAYTVSGRTSKKTSPPSFEDLLTTSVTKPLVTDKTVLVSCDEHWQGIAKKLDVLDEKPMVNEKADQPFGPCFLFGYRHSVFEVDKASLQVASLTLF